MLRTSVGESSVSRGSLLTIVWRNPSRRAMSDLFDDPFVNQPLPDLRSALAIVLRKDDVRGIPQFLVDGRFVRTTVELPLVVRFGWVRERINQSL